MGAETDVIQVRFEAVNQAVAVRAFEQISASSAATEKRMETFDRSVRKSDDTFKRLNDGTSKAAKAMGVFSMAMNGAGAEFGKFGSGALRVAETVMSFGTYLGGPWGIALGAAVGAVSLLSAAFGDATKKAETLDEALANIGGNKTPTQMARLVAAEGRNAEARRRALNDTGFFESVAGRSTHTGTTLADVEAQEKAAEARGQIFERTGGGKGGKRSDFEFESAQRRAETEQRLRALSAQQNQPSRADALQAQIDAPEKKAAETAAKIDAQFAQQRLDRERDTADQLVEIERDRLDRMTAMQEQAAAQQREVAIGAVSAVASVSANALHEAIKGHKMSARAIASSIGDALWADGMANLLKAGAMAFIPGFQGNAGGLAAAASAEIAFAGLLGAATRGGGGASHVRAPHAGRGESGGDFLDRTRAESPSASSRSSGGTTVIQTNNFVSPAVMSPPTAEHGVWIEHAKKEKERAGL